MYKTIKKDSYDSMVSAIVIMGLIIIGLGVWANQLHYENRLLERDIEAVIEKHNKINHEKIECENKIIQGTCLTRNPTIEEVIGG